MSWDRISVEGNVLVNILSDTFDSFRVVVVIVIMEPNGPYWMLLIHQRKNIKSGLFKAEYENQKTSLVKYKNNLISCILQIGDDSYQTQDLRVEKTPSKIDFSTPTSLLCQGQVYY